ncbi:hypothetical protein HUG10_13565 [Halorarum halophilum]|uniref:Asparagine synthase (Glutamine-hydrolysing) n=1 Tax=Halorarum halophilum TaxID=2743090 RepID=A0A7D5KET6_9EURY|nr:hypothetical protein [Halobaculum halophilum]QLG28517.1 hypothetical protein HUG10_13565 [Halobaculum halophilum]
MPDDMYGRLLYRRGFLLFERGSGVDPPAPIDEWDTETLDRFLLRTHPELRYSRAERRGVDVLILGRVFDPINGVSDPETILNTMIDRLGESDNRFFDYLDHLSGRFVLLVEEDDRAFALQDATGNQALFYDTDSRGCRLASHPEMLTEMGGYERTDGAETILDAEAPWFPGAATSYAEVKLLTPNTLLTLPDSEVMRFFPRGPLPSNPLTDELVREVADIFETSVELLHREADLSLSLSAGLDSRLSLAATRNVSDDVFYNTWATGEADKEMGTVMELCENLGIDCAITDLSEGPDDEFLEVFTRNTSGMSRWNRARNAYNLYHRDKPAEDAVEIRSNVSEIARTFYRDRFTFLPDEVRAETFAKLYAYEAQSDYVQGKYREFIDTTDFSGENLYNYDIYDMFYWECRIGCWLSLWFLETSIAQEEVSLFNNRHLLKKMLSVPYERRRSDELFYRVIEELWPDCLSAPINPHKESRFKGADQLDRFLSGAILRAPAPAYMTIRKMRRKI